MVHISKKPVNREKLNKVFRLFYEILKKSSDEREFLEFTLDLLTPTEQIMIAKRIGIIYLLLKGIDQKSISEYLKVSQATVSKFALLLIDKKERPLIKTINSILKKEKIAHFFEDLFADLLIQPGIKKGHYKLKIRHKIRQQERKMIDI